MGIESLGAAIIFPAIIFLAIIFPAIVYAPFLYIKKPYIKGTDRLCKVVELSVVESFFKMFYMSQMNPKEAFRNTESSVHLPYIAGLSL